MKSDQEAKKKNFPWNASNNSASDRTTTYGKDKDGEKMNMTSMHLVNKKDGHIHVHVQKNMAESLVLKVHFEDFFNFRQI